MPKHTEYRIPETMTQVATVVRRIDNAFYQGYMVIVGRDSREFDASEAIEFGFSILQLVRDFSPSSFEEWNGEQRWAEMTNSSSGTEKVSDNSSPDQME